MQDANEVTSGERPHLSETQRAIRAVASGVVLGLLLSLLGRR